MQGGKKKPPTLSSIIFFYITLTKFNDKNVTKHWRPPLRLCTWHTTRRRQQNIGSDGTPEEGWKMK